MYAFEGNIPETTSIVLCFLNLVSDSDSKGTRYKYFVSFIFLLSSMKMVQYHR